MAAGSAAAQTSNTTTNQKAPAKKQQVTPPPKEIPAGAEEVEPGTYRYTDSLGKKWFLRKTPFGLARFEDTGEPLQKKPSSEDAMAGVKMTEAGDSLHFERAGPFGTYKWDKKKSDLNADEKAAWERQKQAATAPTGPSKQD
jgi:hypothetical protein